MILDERTMRPGVGDDAESRVFVIGDDIPGRESLELLIRTGGWESESFDSADEFLAQEYDVRPCCVILDLTVPGLCGLELQKRLARRPQIPIIFITCHQDVPLAVQAMKAGAVEFLTRPVDDVALLDAIDAAIGRSRAALNRESEMRLLRTCYASLTPREREVLTLVVCGLLNKQIGGELGISEITVKQHRGRVMQKMEAASLPHLVTMAAQLGLRYARTQSDAPPDDPRRPRIEVAL